MSEKTDPFETFEELIGQLIKIPMKAVCPVSDKVDHLERLIEQWRISRFKLRNSLDFEEFLETKWMVDDSHVHFAPTGNQPDRRAGTSPLRLQRKLLDFLLLHQGSYPDVLKCIRGFIGKIHSDLDIRDFKKTETGVIRCFTNTRFAANKLRDYGLLKYTKTEAFKVWVLSLPGILVAAKSLKDPGWRLPVVADPWHGLDPFIMGCAESVREFPAMVQALAELCEPDTHIFRTFDGVLKEAHRLMVNHWEIVQDPDLPSKEREALGKNLIDQLDNVLRYGEFLEELSSSMQIEHLLNQADAAAQKL